MFKKERENFRTIRVVRQRIFGGDRGVVAAGSVMLAGVAVVLSIFNVVVAAADTPSPVPGESQVGPGGRPNPRPGDPKSTIPEKIDPAPGAGPVSPPGKETLSEKLERSDGVIVPPRTGTDMRVPAPVPNPNTTPVIPPPGSPGNPSPVQPK